MKKKQIQGWTKWFILLFFIAANIVPSSAAAAKQGSPSSSKRVIVAFGDSNTQGTNWPINKYDAKSKWVTRLQQTRTVINAGVGGNTTEHGRKRFSKEVLSKKPKAVIIMFGTNDAVLNAKGQPRVSKARFESNLKYFTDTLKARNIHVILMTTIPVIQGNGQNDYYYARYDQRLYTKYNGARQWHNSYNAIVRKVAKQKKVTLIDNYEIMTSSMKGITDRKLIDSGWIDSSGTHLTPQGADVIYRSVSSVLTAKLGK
ncbi:SGNH/GDSL hydrolase family protein [Pseudobacillus badius]|uniref:SGNH/GDSL hydrolase family protein n=1 Tax=Bacillus badius TaxID=1455 RepID=UPI000A487654|nr:SGNH/GDSL hydrolase family protein [Bacillus badius]